VALNQTGRAKDAIACYEQALLLRPDYADAHYNMALAYARMQQSSQAIAAAQKALEFARSKGQTELAKKIEDWLKSYQNAVDRGEVQEKAMKDAEPQEIIR